MRIDDRKRKRGPEENLIPLINIVFLILIFFLVASTLRSFDPDGLELSQAQAEAGADLGPNVLLAHADGRLALAGLDISPDELPLRLAAFASANPDMALLIAPDRDLAAERLIEIVQMARGNGIAEITLIVRKRIAEREAGP